MTRIPHQFLLETLFENYTSKFSTVSGVTISEVFGRDVVMIRGYGWSPSLHAVEFEWTHRMGDLVKRIPKAGKAERDAVMSAVEAALDGDKGGVVLLKEMNLLQPMEEKVLRQAHRQGDALGRGIQEPAWLPSRQKTLDEKDAYRDIRIDQVVIDSFMIEMVRHHVICEERKIVSNQVVKRILLSLLSHVHDGICRDEAVICGEPTDATKFEVYLADRTRRKERRLLPNLEVPGFEDASLLFDGESLTCRRHIPATVQAVAIGRKVGEIIHTGTGIDDRLILDIETLDDGVTAHGVVLSVEMDPLSLDLIA